MMKKWFLLGLIFAIMPIWANDGIDQSLNGIWDSDEINLIIVMNDGNFEISLADVPATKGTYTTIGNTITLRHTHTNVAPLTGILRFELIPGGWLSENQIPIAENKLLEAGISPDLISQMLNRFVNRLQTEIGTYSINGNNLMIMSIDGTIVYYTRIIEFD